MPFRGRWLRIRMHLKSGRGRNNSRKGLRQNRVCASAHALSAPRDTRPSGPGLRRSATSFAVRNEPTPARRWNPQASSEGAGATDSNPPKKSDRNLRASPTPSNLWPRLRRPRRELGWARWARFQAISPDRTPAEIGWTPCGTRPIPCHARRCRGRSRPNATMWARRPGGGDRPRLGPRGRHHAR